MLLTFRFYKNTKQKWLMLLKCKTKTILLTANLADSAIYLHKSCRVVLVLSKCNNKIKTVLDIFGQQYNGTAFHVMPMSFHLRCVVKLTMTVIVIREKSLNHK